MGCIDCVSGYLLIDFVLQVPGSDRVDDGGSQRPEAEVKLQHLLLKSLLKVRLTFWKLQGDG